MKQALKPLGFWQVESARNRLLAPLDPCSDQLGKQKQKIENTFRNVYIKLYSQPHSSNEEAMKTVPQFS